MEPTAILLASPEYVGSLPQETASRYVSTEFIKDCVEKNQQLTLEQYRFSSEQVRTRSAVQRGLAPSEKRGRLPYTPEEDALILSYISKCKSEARGNRVWQTFAKKNLVNRTWQSMKYRYANILSKREVKKGEEEMEEEEEEEDLMKEMRDEDAGEVSVEELPGQPDPGLDSCPPTTSDQKEQPLPQVEEASSSPPVHKRQRSPSPAASAEKPGSSSEPVPETESPGEQPSSKITRLDTGTERDVLETTDRATPSDEGAATAAQQGAMLCNRAKHGAETGRKMGILEMACMEFEDSVQSEDETEILTEDVPPQAKPAEPQSSTSVSNLQQGGVEAQTSEASSRVEAPQAKTVAEPQTSTSVSNLQKDALEAQASEASARVEAPQAKTVAEPQTSTSVSNLQKDALEAQASEASARVEAACPEPVVSAPAPTASKAHLFVFESDTQEEASQPREGDSMAAPSVCQPTGDKEAVVSLTQTQLEEDKQRIRELMKQTNQGLLAVTKALLKSSGDFSAALLLLTGPSLSHGPFWRIHDDHLLMSGDPVELDRLQAKYGQEGVAKRLAFLDG